MSIKKWIALIVVLVLLGAGAKYMMSVDRDERARLDRLYSDVEPLQKERDELVAERESIEMDYALMMRDVSTVQVLFRELDASLFTKAYPVMRDNGITGVIGFSSLQIPGYYKKINVEQYNRLIMDNWGSCYVYETNERFDYWLPNTKRILESRGITAPTAIYFGRNRYRSEYDEILKANGVTTIVLLADSGHGETVTDVTGDFWYTSAMPWNYTGVAADTETLALTDGGNLTFTVSFDSLWDIYEEPGFKGILETWQEYLANEQSLTEDEPLIGPDDTDVFEIPMLRVLNYEQARQTHLETMENNAVLAAEYQRRCDELDSRIAELDEQIRQVYDKWQIELPSTAETLLGGGK